MKTDRPRINRASWAPALGCAILLGLSGGCRSAPVVPEPERPQIGLSREDRVLIVAPHPDDEVLGCAGVIQRAVEMGIPVKVVFLTCGDNNELSFLLYRKHPVLKPRAVLRMGWIRQQEALAAGQTLGLEPDQLIFLGYPDFGTLRIWYSHWGEGRPAFQSMLTRVRRVPYEDAFRFGAPYKGEEILKDLEKILKEFRPTKVFISHPADRHSDHRAAYLFLRVALWDLEREMSPKVYPYLIHYEGWPRRRKSPEDAAVPPRALAHVVAWKVFPLEPEQVRLKEVALKRHRTQ